MGPSDGVIPAELIRAIRQQYLLPWRGIHGVTHWARVLENGLRLAAETGARIQVVSLFAVFHDSRRQNENHDPDHGRRGSALAASLRGTAFDLSDEDFELLKLACDGHTDGLITAEPTVQTCWDADRLDLGRVGTIPNRRYLGTKPARDPMTIAWAQERSERFHVPAFVSDDWNSK
jgi:uncharacterized protein